MDARIKAMWTDPLMMKLVYAGLISRAQHLRTIKDSLAFVDSLRSSLAK